MEVCRSGCQTNDMASVLYEHRLMEAGLEEVCRCGCQTNDMDAVLYELSLMEAGVDVTYVSLAASKLQVSNVAQMLEKVETFV